MKTKDPLRYCGLIGSRVFWRLAPLWYRHTSDRDAARPFKQKYIDPADIERWTGREFAHLERWDDLGDIRGGDWDQRLPSNPPQWKQKLFFNSQFSDSVFYQSMVEHFCGDVAWPDTAYGSYALDLVDSGEKFRGRSSEKEILAFLEKVDKLYEQIKKQGYLSQRELQQTTQTGRYLNFKKAVNHEVCVDISRNGDYLFVDGRHRLSIAKILDIDQIPVTVIVRHAKWANKN